MTLSTAEFDFLKDLLYRESGIFLETGKEYLVDARLSGLLPKLRIASVADLIARLRDPSAMEVRRIVVESMTTNETSFFRDGKPFEVLKCQILPELINRRAASRTLNLWCAASSTWQEPYTVAMILDEVIPDLANWKINFIATDISRQMIERSRAGVFSQIEISRGLPAQLLVKHFAKRGLQWEISERLRKLISFRELNLLHSWPDLGELDIVFIRNVLIYFDTNTKRSILGRIGRIMRPDGYLFLGGAETTLNLDDQFQRLPIDRSGCYLRKAPPSLAAAA
jgi:chemotaxis protein methyltransferase CheR